MVELDRRAVLQLAALGAAGTGVAACAAPVRPAARPSAQPQLAPFVAGRASSARPSLPRRVAWANTSNVGIFVAVGEGMRAGAEDVGLDYVTADAEGDPQAHVDHISEFLARGIGGMTIQPLNPAAETPLMRRALGRGVCVMGIINNPCTIQVAASQYRIGLLQGRAAAEHIRTVLGGRATVFNANLNEISPQLVLRNEGVLAGLREAGGGVRVIDQYVSSGDQNPQRVFSIVSTLLQRHPHVDVVLGVDGFVLPAYRTFQQLRRLRPTMYFSSVDGDPEALDLVGRDGPYRASLAFAWRLIGYGMARFTAEWLAGRQVPRVVVAKATLVDSPAAATTFLADTRDAKRSFEDPSTYGKYLPLLGNVGYGERRVVWNSDYLP